MKIQNTIVVCLACLPIALLVGCSEDEPTPNPGIVVPDPPSTTTDTTGTTTDTGGTTTDTGGTTTDTGPGTTDTTDPTDLGTECPTEGACDTEDAKRCDGTEAWEVCAKDADGCLVWSAGAACEVDGCTGVAKVCTEGDDGVSCEIGADAPEPCADVVATNTCLKVECNEQSRTCEEVADGAATTCDDGNVCTVDDQCFDGECLGTDECPRDCFGGTSEVLSTFECGTTQVISLNDTDETLENPATSVMDGYGCDGGMTDYSGFERVWALDNPLSRECDLTLSVEVISADASMPMADLMLLTRDDGICNPQACSAQTVMDETGRAEYTMTLDADAGYVLVADGVSGFAGEIRVTASCCGQAVETYCGDGEDNDGDGQQDCSDDDCWDSPACTGEFDCSDGADNDGDSMVDCEDTDCTNSDACAVDTCDTSSDDPATYCADPLCANQFECLETTCENAAVVTCGDIVTVDAPGTDSYAGDACGLDGISYTNVNTHLIHPDCDGSYTVSITSESWADVMFLGPNCTDQACSTGCMNSHSESSCALVMSGTEGAPDTQSISFNSAVTPHTWLAVGSELGDPPNFTVAVECSCN